MLSLSAEHSTLSLVRTGCCQYPQPAGAQLLLNRRFLISESTSCSFGPMRPSGLRGCLGLALPATQRQLQSMSLQPACPSQHPPFLPAVESRALSGSAPVIELTWKMRDSARGRVWPRGDVRLCRRLQAPTVSTSVPCHCLYSRPSSVENNPQSTIRKDCSMLSNRARDWVQSSVWH